jgi:hypothetical protein
LELKTLRLWSLALLNVNDVVVWFFRNAKTLAGTLRSANVTTDSPHSEMAEASSGLSFVAFETDT